MKSLAIWKNLTSSLVSSNMDSKTFTAELAKRIGRDRRTTDTLLDGLRQAILTHCSEQQPIAIPGFGTFEAVKHDEKIVPDRASDGYIMLPPAIELIYSPASKLRSL